VGGPLGMDLQNRGGREKESHLPPPSRSTMELQDEMINEMMNWRRCQQAKRSSGQAGEPASVIFPRREPLPGSCCPNAAPPVAAQLLSSWRTSWCTAPTPSPTSESPPQPLAAPASAPPRPGPSPAALTLPGGRATGSLHETGPMCPAALRAAESCTAVLAAATALAAPAGAENFSAALGAAAAGSSRAAGAPPPPPLPSLQSWLQSLHFLLG
jgi:hypothetical protein